MSQTLYRSKRRQGPNALGSLIVTLAMAVWQVTVWSIRVSLKLGVAILAAILGMATRKA